MTLLVGKALNPPLREDKLLAIPLFKERESKVPYSIFTGV